MRPPCHQLSREQLRNYLARISNPPTTQCLSIFSPALSQAVGNYLHKTHNLRPVCLFIYLFDCCLHWTCWSCQATLLRKQNLNTCKFGTCSSGRRNPAARKCPEEDRHLRRVCRQTNNLSPIKFLFKLKKLCRYGVEYLYEGSAIFPVLVLLVFATLALQYDIYQTF